MNWLLFRSSSERGVLEGIAWRDVGGKVYAAEVLEGQQQPETLTELAPPPEGWSEDDFELERQVFTHEKTIDLMINSRKSWLDQVLGREEVEVPL